MKILIPNVVMLMSFAGASADDARSLFDFNQVVDRQGWVAVNDSVMGGRSEGGAEFRDGVLFFSGALSLENNGGFASVRHEGDIDLAGCNGIRIRVRGDGRSYQLRLQTDARYEGRPVSFSTEFATKQDDWTELDLPFSSLQQSFRGRNLSGYKFDPAQTKMIGVLLADKKPGPFGIEIAWIAAYR